MAPTGAPVLGDWIWLFPLTYGAHLVDELGFGDGFPAWVSARTSVDVGVEQFAALNATLFVGMLVLVVVARWWRAEVILVLAAVVTLNGLVHLGASVASRTVVPGMVTGVLLWLPLGVGTLRWGARRYRPSILGACVALGVGLHAAVSSLLLF